MGVRFRGVSMGQLQLHPRRRKHHVVVFPVFSYFLTALSVICRSTMIIINTLGNCRHPRHLDTPWAPLYPCTLVTMPLFHPQQRSGTDSAGHVGGILAGIGFYLRKRMGIF